MKAEYDFSNGIRNPYIQSGDQISLNINENALEYFKNLAKSKGVGVDVLINLFLEDCAKRKLDFGILGDVVA